VSLSILQPMQALLASKSYRLATCWKIERRDGVVLLFTDHDFPLVFNNETYLPAASVDASARQKQVGLSPANAQFIGGIDSSYITTEDLRAGKYREAKVTESVVDHRFPWAGVFSQFTYWIVQIVFSGTQWEANVAGLTRWLQPQLGRLYTKVCNHTLGDAGCTLDLTSFTFTASITSLGANPRKVLLVSSLAGKGAGFFDNGKLVFNTGSDVAPDGYEIKTYDTTTGSFTLFMPLPFDAVIGNSITAVAGCDQQPTTCLNKFSNVVNFGGFPFVPGNNAMVVYPNASGGTS
jgi:uncharacterized phage protein (TIGR02218 family)